MTTARGSTEREDQVRRTRRVRRGVVAAGTTGAIGAAIAIGATTQATGSADTGTPDREQIVPDDTGDSFEAPDDRGFDPAPQVGRLAAPSSGGPAQGRSSGS